MEPDLAPSGSAICKLYDENNRIRCRKDSEKSDISAFLFSKADLLFSETWYNK